MDELLTGVAKIISDIRDTAGKKDKENIIAQHKDNELFKKVLNHIFNPYIKTNIAKKKLAKKVDDGIEIKPLLSIDEYMSYLQHSSGKDEQIATVQNYIKSQPAELRWLLESMAIKDLKIGATSKTINKAFGYDFIPTFDVMLAEKFIESKKINGVSKVYEHWKRYIQKRVIITKKFDGNRCAIFVHDDGKVVMYSREGHLLEGYVELEEAFKQFPSGFVYDGEILATNEEGLNSKELFQKTSKIVRKKGIKKGVEFHAFDIIPIKEFLKGRWEVSCEDRKDALKKVINKVNHPLVFNVEIIYIGEFDKELTDKLSEDAKANEEEGIMIQLAEAPYQCKRTFDILKYKSFESCDIRCIGTYEGKTGKNIGRLGGLILDYHGYPVKVGGGFSDEQRISFWENKDLVLGKIIEITYFEEFENENGELDLRFAQFKTIREDKTEPSYH